MAPPDEKQPLFVIIKLPELPEMKEMKEIQMQISINDTPKDLYKSLLNKISNPLEWEFDPHIMKPVFAL